MANYPPVVPLAPPFVPRLSLPRRRESELVVPSGLLPPELTQVPAAPVGGPVAMTPPGGTGGVAGSPSRVSQFVPGSLSQEALRGFTSQPPPPELNPTLTPVPTRNLRSEGRRQLEAGLLAGGLGLLLSGGRGDASFAPSLASAAMGGTSQGQDERFDQQVRQTAAENEQAIGRAQLAQGQYMSQLRGLQSAAAAEQDANQVELRRLQGLDELDQQAEANRLKAEALAIDQQEAQGRVATAQEAQAATERGRVLDLLAASTPESQQRLLDSMEQSGELARLRLDRLFMRGGDGQWGTLERAQSGPDPRMGALREQAQGIRRQLDNPLLTPAAKAALSSQLATVEAQLGGVAGPALGADSFLSMSPADRERLRLQEQESTRRAQAEAARLELDRARVELARRGVQIDTEKLALDRQKTLASIKGAKPGDWLKDGAPKVAEYENRIASVSAKVAELRQTRKVATDLGHMVEIPPTPEGLMAADALERSIAQMRQTQTEIAARFGRVRNSSGLFAPPSPRAPALPTMPNPATLTSPSGPIVR